MPTRVRWSVCFLLFHWLADQGLGFLAQSPVRRRRGAESAWHRRRLAVDDDGNDMDKKPSISDDDNFMASLSSRVKQVSDRETKLPLVVLDSMLPRQVLKLSVSNAVFMDLVQTRLRQETPWFGMLGVARVSTGETVLMKSGVQVDIVGKPAVVMAEKSSSGSSGSASASLQLELRGGRRFRIVGEIETAAAGWTEARVEFLNDGDSTTATASATTISTDDDDDGTTINEQLTRAISKAQPLTALVDEWILLARTKERQSGQIDRLLMDLGPMPSVQDEPSDVAFWVGALVNPIPAMGVALEIRPALLTARNAEERVDIAVTGITRSIRHMRGEPLLPRTE